MECQRDYDGPPGRNQTSIELMPVYVAVIKSKSILAFHAEDSPSADQRMLDPLFRDDLMTLITGGVPLWDGITDIAVRQALSSEEAHWQASRAKAIRQGNIDGEDKPFTIEGLAEKVRSILDK